MDRALAAMGPAFQQVYSLLPTLLHYHHPLMPGYLDGNVPKGICLYTPDETQRHYLNELELYRGMSVQDPPKGELPITGVYTMGSTSSVGQSCSSDLDIWVCHQSWLDSEERQLLQRKCSLLENWAASLGVEVSFFLIDENRFRHNESGSLGGEDCGSTQHILLLDEFYRTAVRLANEQNYHFQVLSILLDKLGFEWGKDLVHFSYGMVELPEGKMKSREGTVVDADDLMEAMIETAKETSNELGKLDGLTQKEADDIARIVGLGALKYFILKVDARKNMTFNPKESIDFNGNTGPFIQYTYARIQSILRKATEAGLSIPAVIPSGIELSTKEEGLIQMLADFTNVVKQAGTDYNPSILANYAYDLVKEYNQFYHDFSILREENEALKIFRLALSQNVGKVVKLAMGLLGIEVPERM